MGLLAARPPVRVVGRHERGKASELRAGDRRPDMNRRASHWGKKRNPPWRPQPKGRIIAVARSMIKATLCGSRRMLEASEFWAPIYCRSSFGVNFGLDSVPRREKVVEVVKL
jgi:hypothetical protein